MNIFDNSLTRTETGSMTNDEQFDRKLFHRRQILDWIRLYLDISEPMLIDMHTSGLIAADELEFIKRLPWPANRNELLQLLVKHTWTSASFTAFCSVLERSAINKNGLNDSFTLDITPPPPKSNQVLAQKLRQEAAKDSTLTIYGVSTSRFTDSDGRRSFKGKDNQLGNGSRPRIARSRTMASSSSFTSVSASQLKTPSSTMANGQLEEQLISLESLLEPLSMSGRCTVRLMIRDRDDRIQRLTAENDRLQADLLRCEYELDASKTCMRKTDRTLTDWFSSLPMTSSTTPTSSLSSIPSSPSSLDGQQTSVASIQVDLDVDHDAVIATLGAVRRSFIRQAERLEQVEADNLRLAEALQKAEAERDQLAEVQLSLSAERDRLVQRVEEAEKRAEVALSASNALKQQLIEIETQLETYQQHDARKVSLDSDDRRATNGERFGSADSSDSVDSVDVASSAKKKPNESSSAGTNKASANSSGSGTKLLAGRDRNEDQSGSGSRTPANSRASAPRSLLAGPAPVRRVSDVAAPVRNRRTSVVTMASSVGSGLERRVASMGGKTPPAAGRAGVGSTSGTKTRRASIAFLPSIDSRT